MWSLPDWLLERYGALTGALVLTAMVSTSTGASLHILLHKRTSASAVAWTGLVWLSPLIGPLLYLVLGVNRVQRKAVRLLGRGIGRTHPPPLVACALPEEMRAYAPLALAVGAITREPLVGGNRIELLRSGDEAYPAMLGAIAEASRSVCLLTYILDDDAWGRRFVSALAEAHQRGVAVRVLIDGIGARRSFAPVRRLRRAGVPTEVFLWSWAPWKMALVNLRNHRKLLIADGSLGFTGGMNIQEAYVHDGGPGRASDLHFRVRGPVLRQLQAQFVVDWAFSAGEGLGGPAWFPELASEGTCFARAIPDGPDEDLMKLHDVLFQGIGAAQHRILILTPYFAPPEPLAVALRAAARRGVRVEIVLPENNVPRFMNRVAIERSEALLEEDVRIGFVPGPFEHGKLMVVDDVWVLLGSSNWDARSLRLNFESNVEVYDPALARDCCARLAEVLASVRWLTLDEVRGRPPLRRLADAGLRLFEAYL